MYRLTRSILATAVFAASTAALTLPAAAQDAIAEPGAGAPLAMDAVPGASKVAFIGVATSIASPPLREQLNLPRGVGLVIDSVDADSPAQLAGLQPHDVLHKLGDQVLINVQQFAVLVRLHNPGERLTLSVIRRGQPLETEITLGERLLPPIDDIVRLQPGGGGLPAAPMPRPGTGRISGVITHSDAAHSITITTHDEDHTVLVKDRAGKIVFEGPLNTAEDRASIPEALREKIARVETAGRQVHDRRDPPPPAVE